MNKSQSRGVVRSYSTRPTQYLIALVDRLNKRDMEIPSDLSAALNERGIEVSDI